MLYNILLVLGGGAKYIFKSIFIRKAELILQKPGGDFDNVLSGMNRWTL